MTKPTIEEVAAIGFSKKVIVLNDGSTIRGSDYGAYFMDRAGETTRLFTSPECVVDWISREEDDG